MSLAELNRAFSAWLDVSYHQRVHSETRQTPEERYHQGCMAFRKVDLASVTPYFMENLQRKVHSDFSDVQLHNMFFKVDPKLRGDTVRVHFDPYGDMQEVLIYSLDEQFLAKATRHDREKASPLPPSKSSQKAQHRILDEFVRIHDQILKEQAKGLDYSKIPKSLPFHDLAKELARLLGVQGGVTGLSQRQLHLIHKTHSLSPGITKPLVMRAFQETHDPSLMAVLYTLKTLAQRKES